MIEKHIHQIWLQGNPPQKYINHVNTWKNIKGWKYTLWDEEKIINLIDLYGKDCLMDVYNKLNNPQQKSDIGRFLILHYYGGIYVDVDIMRIGDLKGLPMDSDIILIRSPIDIFHRFTLQNSFIGARKDLGFAANILKEICVKGGGKTNGTWSDISENTGSLLIKSVINRHHLKNDIKYLYYPEVVFNFGDENYLPNSPSANTIFIVDQGLGSDPNNDFIRIAKGYSKIRPIIPFLLIGILIVMYYYVIRRIT